MVKMKDTSPSLNGYDVYANENYLVVGTGGSGFWIFLELPLKTGKEYRQLYSGWFSLVNEKKSGFIIE